ncbi:hypothetical protein HDU97_001227 [Phlyctochytrium planicorne]|nr:hypothetical protein HDU97_001227 [Phlyctochytrium planicorne]
MVDNSLVEDVRYELESQTVSSLNLGIVKSGNIQELLASNRTFRGSAPCPTRSNMFLFAAARQPKEWLRSGGAKYPQDKVLVEFERASLPYGRTSFINATFGIFASLQVMWKEFEEKLEARRAEERRSSRGYEGNEMDLDEEEMEDEDGDEPLTAEGLLRFGLDGKRDGAIGGLIGRPTETRRTFPLKRKHLQRVSSLYRSEMQSHLLSLQHWAKSVEEGQSADVVKQEIAIFQAVHSIWFLSEIMFMESGGELHSKKPLEGSGDMEDEDEDGVVPSSTYDGTRYVAEDLMKWVNFTWPKPTREDYEEITSGAAEAIDNDKFWHCLTRCVLRGLFHAASNLLQMLLSSSISKWGTASGGGGGIEAVIVALTRLLHGMPKPSTLSAAEFANKWRRWREDCNYHAEDNYLTSVLGDPSEDDASMSKVRNQLHHVFLILSGHSETIVDMAEHWAEAMMGLIIFTNPTVSLEDVSNYLAEVRHIFVDEDEDGYDYDEDGYETVRSKESGISSSMDKAFASLLELDLDTAIRHCTRIDNWLVTHLTDILDKFGRLDREEGKDPIAILTGVSQPEVEEQEEEYFDEEDGEYYTRSVAVVKKPAFGEKLPTLREWYIMEYSETLCMHSSLWRVGVEYLALGGGKSEECLARLEAHVLRIDPADGTGAKFRKLLGFATEVDARWKTKLVHASRSGRLASGPLGLGDLAEGLGNDVPKLEIDRRANFVVQTAHRVAARRRLANGRLGEAIDHYAKALDLDKAVIVGDKVLKEHVQEYGSPYLAKSKKQLAASYPPSVSTPIEGIETTAAKPKEVAATRVMDELNPVIANLSNRLSFLSEYRKYQKLYETERWREAGEALVKLFTGGLAPKFMWGKLLLEAVPLLEGPPKYSSELRKGRKDDYQLFKGLLNPRPNDDDPPIDSAGTYELMRCLEELLLNPHAVTYLLDPFPGTLSPLPSVQPAADGDPSKAIVDVGSHRLGYGMSTLGIVLKKGPKPVNPFVDSVGSFASLEPGSFVGPEELKVVEDGVGGKKRFEELKKWKGELDLVRLALTRNLARTTMVEMGRHIKGEPIRQPIREHVREPAPPTPAPAPLSVATPAKAPATPAAGGFGSPLMTSTPQSTKGALFGAPTPFRRLPGADATPASGLKASPFQAVKSPKSLVSPLAAMRLSSIVMGSPLARSTPSKSVEAEGVAGYDGEGSGKKAKMVESAYGGDDDDGYGLDGDIGMHTEPTVPGAWKSTADFNTRMPISAPTPLPPASTGIAVSPMTQLRDPGSGSGLTSPFGLFSSSNLMSPTVGLPSPTGPSSATKARVPLFAPAASSPVAAAALRKIPPPSKPPPPLGGGNSASQIQNQEEPVAATPAATRRRRGAKDQDESYSANFTFSDFIAPTPAPPPTTATRRSKRLEKKDTTEDEEEKEVGETSRAGSRRTTASKGTATKQQASVPTTRSTRSTTRQLMKIQSGGTRQRSGTVSADTSMISNTGFSFLNTPTPMPGKGGRLSELKRGPAGGASSPLAKSGVRTRGAKKKMEEEEEEVVEEVVEEEEEEEEEEEQEEEVPLKKKSGRMGSRKGKGK